MKLNEVNWLDLVEENRVISDFDQIEGNIVGLEQIGGLNFVTILWTTGIQMRFNQAWMTDITYLGE